MFTKHVICALLVAAAAGSASAGRTEIGPDPSAGVIPAAKRDSGLGELRPLNGESPGVWLYAIPAESLDSGLGDLPPLSEWRAPWLYAMAAEKVDSGLGELPPIHHDLAEDEVAPAFRRVERQGPLCRSTHFVRLV